jgi:hypothetical protein
MLGSPPRGDKLAAGADVGAPAIDAVVNDDPPILVGSLRGRRFSVHLYTDHRYTVEDAHGELVGELLTDAEFAEQYPEVHQETQDMLARSVLADNWTDRTGSSLLRAPHQP